MIGSLKSWLILYNLSNTQALNEYRDLLSMVYIQSIGTALPNFITRQDKIADFMVRNFHLDERAERKLRVLYRASGISQRYSDG